jgi:outer membrane receptor protein involved in Fe transport
LHEGLQNAARATIRGLEIENTLHPTNFTELTLNCSVGYALAWTDGAGALTAIVAFLVSRYRFSAPRL